MKPFLFWSRPPLSPGWQAFVLAPLATLYAAATAARVAKKASFNANIPVICVGNLNIGGTGKTPTVIALAERLLARGIAVHIVSRGYGGNLKGPVRVKETIHSAVDVGDEPLLLAAFAPTWVARDRATGIQAAQTAGAEVILMDDGFQNPSVHKDLNIVVVDANHGFGNGRVLPAGPLREPVKVGLVRADILLSIGDRSQQQRFTQTWGESADCPQCKGQLIPLAMGMDWKGLDVLAFAGIGHPQKFFATLKGLGARILRGEALDDHQPLTEALMLRLERDADALNAQLVTTEKDAVRLPRSFRTKVLTLPVRLQLEDWSLIDAELMRLKLTKKGHS